MTQEITAPGGFALGFTLLLLHTFLVTIQKRSPIGSFTLSFTFFLLRSFLIPIQKDSPVSSFALCPGFRPNGSFLLFRRFLLSVEEDAEYVLDTASRRRAPASGMSNIASDTVHNMQAVTGPRSRWERPRVQLARSLWLKPS